jgi:uncharacterized protein (DUF2237 family)
VFESRNVFGKTLVPCSMDPVTGFYRDGCCNTGDQDHGIHTVCVQATEEFLEYTKAAGNDLSTPRQEFQFPGVKPGDYWCLCAGRWLEAYKAGKAPKVRLESTHEESLAIIPLEILQEYAIETEAK